MTKQSLSRFCVELFMNVSIIGSSDSSALESNEANSKENKNPIPDGIISLFPQANQPKGDHQAARAMDDTRKKEVVISTSRRLNTPRPTTVVR